MNRRRLLLAGTGALVTAFSGCSSSEADSSPDPADETPSQNDQNDSAPQDGETTPAEEGPDDDIGNYTPDDVATRYYEALAGGDTSTLDELSHSDGIVTHTQDIRADQVAEGYDLTIERVETTFEDFLYFYQPSALVEVGYEQARTDNSTSFVTRDEVVLVVEDGELLVYDTKRQDEYFRPAPLADSCDMDGAHAVEDRLPLISESFYPVSRDESFGVWDTKYRGPDGNWLFLHYGFHDSEAEAEEVEIDVGTTYGIGDGSWTAEAGLLARKDNMTCTVSVGTADATEQVEALYQEVGCFTDDDIIEQSW